MLFSKIPVYYLCKDLNNKWHWGMDIYLHSSTHSHTLLTLDNEYLMMS